MKAYALTVSIVFLAVALLISVFFYNAQNAKGSVQHGGEYTAITITTGTSTAKTRAGTLGSVVITDGGNAGAIYFYATTSITATNTLDQILVVDGAAVENTYTFDVGFGHGLQIESRDFNGTAIVTWR